MLMPNKALLTLAFALSLPLQAAADDIHDAAKSGDVAKVINLIDAGAMIDAIDLLDKTALIWASENDHTDVVQALVDRGASVDNADFTGRTALYFAATEGFEGIVQILIEAGADVNLEDSEGTRPLDHPINRGHAAIIEILTEAGAVCGTNFMDSRACNEGFGHTE